MSGEKRVEQSAKNCIVYYISNMNIEKIKKFKLTYHKDENINALKKQTKSSISKSN